MWHSSIIAKVGKGRAQSSVLASRKKNAIEKVEKRMLFVHMTC